MLECCAGTLGTALLHDRQQIGMPCRGRNHWSMSSRCRGRKAGVSVMISTKREVMSTVHSAHDFEQMFQESFPHLPASLRRPLAASLAVRMLGDFCRLLHAWARSVRLSSVTRPWAARQPCWAAQHRQAVCMCSRNTSCTPHSAERGREAQLGNVSGRRRTHQDRTWAPAHASAAWWGPDWPFSATQLTPSCPP